ncbi:GTP diphosphokinase [Kaarinaea lacus]
MVTVSKQKTTATFAEGLDFDSWLKHIGDERSAAEVDAIRRAHELMDGVIEHQQDILGDTEYTRTLKIAEILSDLHVDTNTLVATLLHGILPSRDISPEQIEQDFGQDVLNLVNGINKMRIVDAYQVNHSGEQRDKKGAERVRNLLLALAEDIRVVLIKIAERLYTMRKLKFLSEDVRVQIASETKEIFAPLASRLGIWQIKWEMEDLSFRYLEPDTYKRIASMLDERRIDREQYINKVTDELSADLASAGIKAEVTGRPKHIFSIWRKMQSKNLDFNELFDVRATRVLVDNIADCYAVLGIVHTKWRPIRSEFDDYIATPKENNYRSLHTAVIGPENKTVEVQIRTFDMHEHAEYGVASHWGYKEGGKLDVKYQEKITWLRQLLEIKEEDSPEDIVERFKSEIFEDRVYVLTPKGRVIDLPKGATPLDFAYSVHTEVGHHFRGAKADGKIIPISYQLQNGQQIEVLTSKHSHPSRDWLNPHLGYVKSPRARAKIRAWFKQQDYERNLSEGRSTLERELQRLGISDIPYEQISARFKFQKLDDFLVALGRGDLTTNQIANAVNELIFPAADKPVSPATVHPFQQRQNKKLPDEVKIEGVGDLMTQTARCCKPVPYDAISGYITRGRGVTIHRKDCRNILRLQRAEHERVIDVEWGSETPKKTYPVEIVVHAFDRQGLLRDITTILTNSNLNVLSMNTFTDKKTYMANLGFTIEVANADQLSVALTKIEHLQNVMEVSRKTFK